MSVIPDINDDPLLSDFYQEILGQMQPKLLGYIMSLVANAVDAQDVLQESNRVITAKLDELRQADRFAAWAYRIAYYQSLAFLKKSGRDRHQFGDELLSNIAAMSEEVAEATETGLARLDRCLARLPDRSRFVVSDYYYADLSIEEIGRKRSIQPNHVAQILYRSRKALHACITQLEEIENE
ncbi:MAG: sigma-70 family RNA polymerase sigma factor [Opitutaceae bacterium]|nr:sigma-70 family RNA polymerase sigma factor [Opitutaceae bacterium]